MQAYPRRTSHISRYITGEDTPQCTVIDNPLLVVELKPDLTIRTSCTIGDVVIAKLNQPGTNKIVNHSGHVTYAMDDKDQLVSAVSTTTYGAIVGWSDHVLPFINLPESIMGSLAKRIKVAA